MAVYRCRNRGRAGVVMGCRTDEQLDLGNYLCHGQCLPHQVAEPMNKEQREVSAPGEQKGTMIVFYLFYSSWFGGCDLLINSAHYISLGASIDWQEACKFDCPSPISTRHWRVARKSILISDWTYFHCPGASRVLAPTQPHQKCSWKMQNRFFFLLATGPSWALSLPVPANPTYESRNTPSSSDGIKYLFLFGHLGSGFHFGG